MVGTLKFPPVQDNFEKYCPGLAGTIKFPPVQGYLRVYMKAQKLGVQYNTRTVLMQIREIDLMGS